MSWIDDAEQAFERMVDQTRERQTNNLDELEALAHKVFTAARDSGLEPVLSGLVEKYGDLIGGIVNKGFATPRERSDSIFGEWDAATDDVTTEPGYEEKIDWLANYYNGKDVGKYTYYSALQKQWLTFKGSVVEHMFTEVIDTDWTRLH